MAAATDSRLSVTFEDDEILDALHWCRLGRVRPARDGAFWEARRLGLLAQDPIWRTTAAGELLLARRRRDAYGARPMALACRHCGAEPYDACTGNVERLGEHRVYHRARERQTAPAPIEQEGEQT